LAYLFSVFRLRIITISVNNLLNDIFILLLLDLFVTVFVDVNTLCLLSAPGTRSFFFQTFCIIASIRSWTLLAMDAPFGLTSGPVRLRLLTHL
jgi:hypothetical protein